MITQQHIEVVQSTILMINLVYVLLLLLIIKQINMVVQSLTMLKTMSMVTILVSAILLLLIIKQINMVVQSTILVMILMWVTLLSPIAIQNMEQQYTHNKALHTLIIVTSTNVKHSTMKTNIME